jgi:acyl-CoA synthetase (AMP-forming)/AMP-acid ligase II
MLVGMLVERAATRFAKRIALEGPDGTRTFAELGERVTRLARGLLGLGLTPGDRVLDLQPNGCAAIESDLALATAGLVRVPLDPRLGPGEWTAIADDCGARGFIYDAEFVGLGGFALSGTSGRSGGFASSGSFGWSGAFGSAGGFASPGGFGSSAGITGVVEGLAAGLSTVVTGDGPGRCREDLIREASASPLRLDLPATTLAGLAYSSGTTGRPKGAMRTHRNRIASAQAMAQEVLGGRRREPDSRELFEGHSAAFLHADPLIHTSGLFVLPFLAGGARQVLLEHPDPETIVEAVQAHRITHTALTPTVVARLLATPGIGPERLASLRMLAYAGAPMPEHHIRQAAQLLTPNLVQYYGLVEAMPPLTVLTADDHARALTDRPDLLQSAGRTVRSVELRVVDDEIEVRGEAVMPGYWNARHRDDLDKALEDGWLRTGDLGRLDAEGYLWLTDHRNDMIITAGYNVYPREVEDVVTALDGVGAAAAVGLPDPDCGQRIVVAYTPGGDHPASPEEVLARCRAVLPVHKHPKAAYPQQTLPRCPAGKVSRREVQQLLLACSR